MNPEQTPNTWNSPEDHERSIEQTPPSIYVASLADYVNGYLTGEWIDATQDIDTIREEIQAMLATSKSETPEEYAIHDYEGFGTLRLGEYEDIERIAAIAEGIKEHGEAFACWIDHTGLDPEDWHKFEDAYLGTYDSIEAYADQMMDDLDLEASLDESVPESFRSYVKIDRDALVRDLEYGDIWYMDFDGQVLVFNSHI
ncbi:antirestriction protein [Arthrobacter sp. MYb229]|uniref:antirestriction protein ArdA n=1 Tax=unclassified Arthrobacter TaxID=235627 RepID=UPI000CFBD7E0|nr:MULTISPECIES: antirestriction protein ArdA [unclassified Arthrobacter]PRA06568.1 antirestriction protein [Arthrobacter sp. MYb229]PRB53469.1 antirestriction protein [Arthrobacter sp. MYb216]